MLQNYNIRQLTTAGQKVQGLIEHQVFFMFPLQSQYFSIQLPLLELFQSLILSDEIDENRLHHLASTGPK